MTAQHDSCCLHKFIKIIYSNESRDSWLLFTFRKQHRCEHTAAANAILINFHQQWTFGAFLSRSLFLIWSVVIAPVLQRGVSAFLRNIFPLIFREKKRRGRNEWKMKIKKAFPVCFSSLSLAALRFLHCWRLLSIIYSRNITSNIKKKRRAKRWRWEEEIGKNRAKHKRWRGAKKKA